MGTQDQILEWSMGNGEWGMENEDYSMKNEI